eukprot:9495270-Pyramimonas_sp.AAC.1
MLQGARRSAETERNWWSLKGDARRRCGWRWERIELPPWPAGKWASCPADPGGVWELPIRWWES